jgi:hypothetical protein
MSESLKELEKINAELLANQKKIETAQAVEAEKQADAKKKRDVERRAAEAKAFVARQELKNLESTVGKLVKVYAGYKRNHVTNEVTEKWDAFLADLKGEKKTRKPRKKKTEE